MSSYHMNLHWVDSPLWSDVPLNKMYMRRPLNILTGQVVENRYLSESVAGRNWFSPFTDYKNDLKKTLRTLKQSFSK